MGDYILCLRKRFPFLLDFWMETGLVYTIYSLENVVLLVKLSDICNSGVKFDLVK